MINLERKLNLTIKMSQILLLKRVKSFFQRVPFSKQTSRFFFSSKQISEKEKFSEDKAQPHINLSSQTELDVEYSAAALESKYHPSITSHLYNWQLQRNTRKQWTIHDLPVQLDDKPGLAYFYNKVTKDIINRYKLLKGFKVDFILSFDCHGKAIENSAIRQEIQREKVIRHYSEDEIREISRKYAIDKLKEYILSLQRASCITMSPFYEACVLEVFSELVDKNLIYRDAMPVLWSIGQRRMVYENEIRQKYEPKNGIFVKFKVTDYGEDELIIGRCPNLYFLVFVTEPWTLTACHGITLNPNLDYTIIQCLNGEDYIIATQRYEDYESEFNKLGGTPIMHSHGDFFEDFKVKNPVVGKEIKICSDLNIKASFGSGINSVCPAHILEDVAIAREFGLERTGYVDEKGFLSEELGDEFKGKNVLNDASPFIKERLKQQGKLLRFEEKSDTISFIHIKTGEKIIVRVIDQWFCRTPEPVKQQFLTLLKRVKFYGPEGQKRRDELIKTITNKEEDWCISSDQLWGIPLPVFYAKGQQKKAFLLDKTVISYVMKNFEMYGSDIWWKWNIVDLLPPKYKDKAELFEKETLVFNNWFESGIAWYAILCKKVHEKRRLTKADKEENLLTLPSGIEIIDPEEENKSIEVSATHQEKLEENFPADMVIEGFDQNEELIQSMCLIAEFPPFSAIKNHAVVAEKVFESFNRLPGNTLLLEHVIKGFLVKTEGGERKEEYGADVTRLWVAATDNKEILLKLETKDLDIKNAEINFIRGIYQTLLHYTSNSNIENSSQENFASSPIDCLIIAQLHLFMTKIEKAYEDCNLSQVFKIFMDFMKYYILEIYIETIRHRMVAKPGSIQQKSAQKTAATIIENTLLAISPILCHNAENIYSHINFKMPKDSIFHNNWPSDSFQKVGSSKDLLAKFLSLLHLRDSVRGNYELIAQKGGESLNSRSFEVYFFVKENDIVHKILAFLDHDLEDFFQCGKVKILNKGKEPQILSPVLSTFQHIGKYEDQKVDTIIKICKISS